MVFGADLFPIQRDIQNHVRVEAVMYGAGVSDINHVFFLRVRKTIGDRNRHIQLSDAPWSIGGHDFFYLHGGALQVPAFLKSFDTDRGNNAGTQCGCTQVGGREKFPFTLIIGGRIRLNNGTRWSVSCRSS